MTNRLGRLLPAVALLSLIVLGLTACGGSSGSGTPVTGTLGDFFLKVDPATASNGKITFNVTNSSATQHEFVVIKTDTPEDKLAVDAQGKAGETGKAGEIDNFSGPNITKKLTVNLKAGKYVLICNIPGHYQKGVHAAFTVQ